jgi:glycosyltransferase involved in cell wall biosynthesis
LTFSANFDAIHWFLQSIFPIVKAEIPEAILKITGRTEGVDLSLLSICDGVHFTGYLDDVRPAVAQSWICVVPIRIGGGQRMKIFEAMAIGTPVISTSKGIEGINAQNGENVLISDDPHSFALMIIKLLKEREERDRLSRNARLLMESEYRWERILPQFKKIVESVGIER